MVVMLFVACWTPLQVVTLARNAFVEENGSLKKDLAEVRSGDVEGDGGEEGGEGGGGGFIGGGRDMRKCECEGRSGCESVRELCVGGRGCENVRVVFYIKVKE